MAYVVDRALNMGTYTMDTILVLHMWWIGFWVCIGFIHLQPCLKGLQNFLKIGHSSLLHPLLYVQILPKFACIHFLQFDSHMIGGV